MHSPKQQTGFSSNEPAEVFLCSTNTSLYIAAVNTSGPIKVQ